MERTNTVLYAELAPEKKTQCTSKHRSQKRGGGCLIPNIWLFGYLLVRLKARAGPSNCTKSQGLPGANTKYVQLLRAGAVILSMRQFSIYLLSFYISQLNNYH